MKIEKFGDLILKATQPEMVLFLAKIIRMCCNTEVIAMHCNTEVITLQLLVLVAITSNTSNCYVLQYACIISAKYVAYCETSLV